MALAQLKTVFLNINLLYPLADTSQTQTPGLRQHQWEASVSLPGPVFSDCHCGPKGCRLPWTSDVEAGAALPLGLSHVETQPQPCAVSTQRNPVNKRQLLLAEPRY